MSPTHRPQWTFENTTVPRLVPFPPSMMRGIWSLGHAHVATYGSWRQSICDTIRVRLHLGQIQLATCPVCWDFPGEVWGVLLLPPAPKISGVPPSTSSRCTTRLQYEHEQRHQKDTNRMTRSTSKTSSNTSISITTEISSNTSIRIIIISNSNSESNNSNCKSNNSNSNSSNSHNINRHRGGSAQDLVILGSWCLRWCWCLLIQDSKT